MLKLQEDSLSKLLTDLEYDPSQLEWVQQVINTSIVTKDVSKSLEIVAKPNMRTTEYNLIKKAIEAEESKTQLFDPDMPLLHKECKAIFIGMTGSGKSSIINFFDVWSRDILSVTDIKSTKIPTKYFGGDQTAKNQSVSQTQFSSSYDFHLKAGDHQYKMQFIDTPGLGDTRGFEYDDKNVDNILSEIRKNNELGAIVIMINGTDARVDDRIKYLIQKIKGMLPDKITDNIVLLLSNVSTISNLMYGDLGLKLKKDQVFYMDNSIFTANINMLLNTDKEDPDYGKNKQELYLHQTNYLKTQHQMMKFLQYISKIKRQQTTEFKEIAQSRDDFKVCIVSIQERIKDLVQLREDAKNAIIDIQKNDNTLTDLLVKKEMQKTYQATGKKETPYHNTTCLECTSNCHIQCGLQEITQAGSHAFIGCYAFGGCSEVCQFCHHSYKTHVHTRYTWETSQVTENLVDKDVIAQIQTVTDSNNQKNLLIQGINQKIQQFTAQIDAKKLEIKSLLQKIRALCNEFNYVHELDFYLRLLEQKKQQNHKVPAAVKSIEMTINEVNEMKKLVI